MNELQDNIPLGPRTSEEWLLSSIWNGQKVDNRLPATMSGSISLLLNTKKDTFNQNNPKVIFWHYPWWQSTFHI